MSAALSLLSAAQPVPVRLVLHDSRLGDRRVRVRRGQCSRCRCALARDERRCRRCAPKRGASVVHTRPAAAWLDDFEALRTFAARSNWPQVGMKRVSRARDPESKEDVRVTLILTSADERAALEQLKARPLRRGLDRWEWLSEVWIELHSPPPDVDEPADLDEQIRRAIWRAEKSLRSQK